MHIRQLDKQKIPYIIHTYEWSEDKSGGLGVAEKLPELADRVFKTIVLKGKSKNLYVCVIHGEAHLDLKKVAKACKEKNIDLLIATFITRKRNRIYSWRMFSCRNEKTV